MPGGEELDGLPTFHAASIDDWRVWLEANCQSARSVWLIVYHKRSRTPSAHFHDVIEHALCYGWVDSKAVRRDGESCYLKFSPRDPKSTWGRVNRERAQKMARQGLMTPHGQTVIDEAKATGTWDALADAQNSVVPEDLQQLFDHDEIAFANFQAFPPSSKRLILEWIAKAKRPETRRRRLDETVARARDNIRAHHPE